MSVVANPKTDSMRTKAAAAAAAAAAVSVGSSFAACGKKFFGPFFARRARKNGERGAFLSRNGNFKNLGLFFKSHPQFLKILDLFLSRTGNF